MLKRHIVWKMALANISRSWRQTLLTVFAGAIGAMLVVVSYVNYASTNYSSKAWLDRHYGNMKWELSPTDNKEIFSRTDVEEIINAYEEYLSSEGYRMLPIVQSQSILFKLDEQGELSNALAGAQTMGFDLAAAASFDPEHSGLWSTSLSDDAAIIDEGAAKLLKLSEGDAVRLKSASGIELTFQIRQIVKPEGLTGYRGPSAESAATVIVSEASARKLAELEDGYKVLLATSDSTVLQGLSYPAEIQDKFRSNMMKWNAQLRADKMSSQMFIVTMISAVAVVSSALLMRQVLIMIADSRRELFGVLRAIGFSKQQIRGLFGAEALLLAGISAVIGTLLGAGGGLLLVKLFYGKYAQELARVTGANIPVEPHVSVGALVIVWAIIVMFLALIALFAVRAVNRTRIVDALRRTVSSNQSGSSMKRPFMGMVVIFSAAAIAAHLSQLFGEPPEATGSSLLTILVLWLAAVIGTVLIASRLAANAAGPIGAVARAFRFPNVSVLLAGKFTRQHPSRTVTIILLFALIMMTITFTASMSTMILKENDVKRTNQTMLGFGGYVGYHTVEQKERILQLVETNETIQQYVSHSTYVEPYMLLIKDNGMDNSIVPVTESLLEGGGLHLREWASQFASEQEAWEAVRDHEEYIILPLDYLYADTRSDRASFDRQVLAKAGETIELPIYENKPFRSINEQWRPVETRSFVVAGFAENNSASQLSTALFRPLYMNAAVHEQLRPYSTKWPEHDELGYVLLQFDYHDIKKTQRIEEQMLLSGVSTFQSPFVNKRAEQLVNMQMSRGFIGFTAISALIGLFGLAIVQLRAVGERAAVIAMLRCVGLSGQQIKRMFILEGSMIGIIGLLVGWMIGSSGSAVFVRTLTSDVSPGETPLTFDYPYVLILSILIMLLAAAVAVNLGPARGALKLAPAEALRSAD
ncbi:ABC transporter permease [Paenibacillus xylaniclasticus]|uniref:ABC transporter permease n=1 Tax=Paenibacillus xylaniclasticus TaxID=588083 RepID=UPI000FD9CB5D|nr:MULTISPECIES: FtsX-like permease family protein [Paenibacillus]GFN32048.1 hypothetical protein PCURB6_23080 [Paenibacillus curdlanolyticus]